MVCKSQNGIRLNSAVWPSCTNRHHRCIHTCRCALLRLAVDQLQSHDTTQSANLILNWADGGCGGALTIRLGSRSAIHPILSKLRHRRSESFLITTFHIIAFSFICTLAKASTVTLWHWISTSWRGLKLDSLSFSVAFIYFNLFNLGLLLWFINKKKNKTKKSSHTCFNKDQVW